MEFLSKPSQLLKRYPHLIEISKSVKSIKQFKVVICEFWRLLDLGKVDLIIRFMATRIKCGTGGGIHAFSVSLRYT